MKAPRGAADVLPPTSDLYEGVIRTSEDLFRLYGYRRIETPVFEHTEVFERGLDEASAMVTKEMYTFLDRSGRSMTLRPEGTAPVVRAVIEHHLDREGLPVKLYYTAPMFRYERPQAGRRRQHTQVGVEAVGSEAPEVDAEVVALASAVFRQVGLAQVRLLLNSVGHSGCRSVYLPKLIEFLEGYGQELCTDCRRKTGANPLRTFDCKVEKDREILSGAPLITDYLCGSCADHLDAVQGLLTSCGVTFIVEPRLVRGLDYYTRTAFEFQAAGLGAQNAVGGGGRYDGLAELLGGGRVPGIGFGLGVERIAEAIETQGAQRAGALDVFIVSVGEDTRRGAFSLAMQLRGEGISCDLDFSGRPVKGQFKAADRLGAARVVVIGERELAEGRYTVRDMSSGEETPVAADELFSYLRGKR